MHWEQSDGHDARAPDFPRWNRAAQHSDCFRTRSVPSELARGIAVPFAAPSADVLGLWRLPRVVDRGLCSALYLRSARTCQWECAGTRLLHVRGRVLGNSRRAPGRLRCEGSLDGLVAQGWVLWVDVDVRGVGCRLRLGGLDMPLLILSALFLVGCGVFAILQAATGHFLPHDTVYLGMTASQVCAWQDCRILHFMIHDRISFGGVLVAIGTVYLWLTMFPLRRRERWAWSALAASGSVGFLSFLAYLGYGYFDRWHGAATLALMMMFMGGLVRARRLRRESAQAITIELRSALGAGRALLLLSSVGMAVAGLTIVAVGMTTVFVPQDLE